MMAETWKAVSGFQGYLVSDAGRVRGRSGKIMKAKPSVDGYRRVKLWRDGHSHNKSVHRLVLLAFVGEPGEGEETLHENDTKDDNRLENLSWGTHKQNGLDAAKNGKIRSGMRHWNARLTDAEVISIRADPRPQRAIAADFRISQQTVSDIKRRKRRATT